ncbi:MAG: pyrroloquinoline quinone biosynthesis protein PqqD [Pedosphaera sp.]|nr:pyrroloquinoline quinone biosynthesis protein PqqD [Pedosphaera sp.]
MSSIDEKSCPALVLGVRMQTDVTTGEPVLLFPEGVLHLNSTAHEVVSKCDGKSSVAAIVAALAAEYEVESNALSGDVLECLAELQKRKLIHFKS